jgi:uncharacterized protein (TIGR02453 family)
MIKPQTLQFLKDLAMNNNKGWFEAHRAEYEIAKRNFLGFVENVQFRIHEFDSSITPEPNYRKIFRINRDARFSKDKTPYKHNLAAFISVEPKRLDTFGYYIHLEPGDKSGFAGGFVAPEKDDLNRLRDYIAEHYKELEDLLNDDDFDKYFKFFGDADKALKTTPRGFDKNHPAKEYIRQKMFTVWHPVTDSKVQESTFEDFATEAFVQVHRLIVWLKRYKKL